MNKRNLFTSLPKFKNPTDSIIKVNVFKYILYTIYKIKHRITVKNGTFLVCGSWARMSTAD